MTMFAQTFRGHYIRGDVHRDGEGWRAHSDWWPTYEAGGQTMTAACTAFHDHLPLALEIHHREKCTEKCVCPTNAPRTTVQPTSHREGTQ